MAVALVCDLCNKPFKYNDKEPNVICFDNVDISGEWIYFADQDKYKWHVCPSCRNEMMRCINDMIESFK